MRLLSIDDRQLIILASLAARMTIRWFGGRAYSDPEMETPWEPLWDSGDVFRLAVELEISPSSSKANALSGVSCNRLGEETCAKLVVYHNGDPVAATRRAIVLAAAELGGRMVRIIG